MAILTPKDISNLVAQLDIFAYGCPEFPAREIKAIITDLFAEYTQLIAGKEKAAEKYLSTPRKRVRKTLKKFPYKTPAHIRILANVVKYKKTGCWIWPGTGGRHGKISDESGRQVSVHRAMYEHANRLKLAPGVVVRHTCDNGFCCNPAHLIVGSQRDNAADRVERNRAGFQKLTYKTAKVILLRYLKGEPARTLAKEFDISEGAISKIGIASFVKLNDDPDVKKIPRRRGQLRHSKLTIADVRVIRKRLKRGDLQKNIARDFRIHDTVISAINRGRTWNGVK